MELVHSDRALNYEERLFILQNFHEGAEHLNAKTGAFFTPYDLARDFAINVGDAKRVIDLCAGIGMLSFAVDWEVRGTEMVCVELNPEYVTVGKRVMPKATWIHADVCTYPMDHLGRFACAISNPPFGRVGTTTQKKMGYTGAELEFRIIEVASTCADRGVFIVPQGSCPFMYSGRRSFEAQRSAKYERFNEQTGIAFELGCAIDTAEYRREWKGVAPICEIVIADFPIPEKVSPQLLQQPLVFA